MQEYSEIPGDNIAIILLDWKQAFDNVNQDKLIEGLKRLNLPDKYIHILSGFYNNPQLKVKNQKRKESERHKQLTGIRQGCPLSPYHFVLLMHVLFHDVHDKVGHIKNP